MENYKKEQGATAKAASRARTRSSTASMLCNANLHNHGVAGTNRRYLQAPAFDAVHVAEQTLPITPLIQNIGTHSIMRLRAKLCGCATCHSLI